MQVYLFYMSEKDDKRTILKGVNNMKIKAVVQLSIQEGDGFHHSETLYYKIKYKTDNQKRYEKINKSVATSYLTDWDEYMDNLHYCTRKENIMELVRIIIKEDIEQTNNEILSDNKHKKLLSEINDLNKEKLEFEFEIS